MVRIALTLLLAAMLSACGFQLRGAVSATGNVTGDYFVGNGSGLTGLNIPVGFTELDAALFN